MGEWNEVVPQEGCWTKGGECEGYGPPLSVTTLSPTWEVVAAPWSIDSIGFSLEAGIKPGGKPHTLLECLSSASLYSSYLT